MTLQRLLSAAACAMMSTAFAAEAPLEARSAVERAREALSKKLEEAKSEGVVQLKNQEDQESAAQADGAPPSASPEPGVSALRDGGASELDCLTLSGLVTAAADVDPLGRIDRLTRRAANDDTGDSDNNAIRLAETYLAIGFFDEAYATSARIGGSRAAAISVLAAAATDQMASAPARSMETDRCGELHRLAAKLAHAAQPGDLEFEESDIRLIGSLPPTVAQSIFDYVSVAALDRGDAKIAEWIRELRVKRADETRRSQAQSFVEASLDLAKGEDAPAIDALLSVSSEPGPLRARALKQLIAGKATISDASKISALYSDLEDSLDSASLAEWEETVVENFADYKLKSGDWTGALSVISRAERGHSSESRKSKTTFNAVLRQKLQSENRSEAIAALAFICANAQTSSRMLDEDVFSIAVGELAHLGASRSLEELFEHRGEDAANFLTQRSLAKLRSGDIDGLRQLISDRIESSVLLKMLEAIASEDRKEPIPKIPAQLAGSPDAAQTLARIAWTRGDWALAEKYFRAAYAKAPREELIEHAALAGLAALAESGSPQADISPYGPDLTAAIKHMLSAPPNAGQTESLREFSMGVAQEIDFARKSGAR